MVVPYCYPYSRLLSVFYYNLVLQVHYSLVFIEDYVDYPFGQVVVNEEQKGKAKADYGKKLLENLSAKLTKDFGKGFDPSNLWNMRKFYLTFPILDALRRELSWTHYRQLLRVDDDNARSFYLKRFLSVERGLQTKCLKAGWDNKYLLKVLGL